MTELSHGELADEGLNTGGSSNVATIDPPLNPELWLPSFDIDLLALNGTLAGQVSPLSSAPQISTQPEVKDSLPSESAQTDVANMLKLSSQPISSPKLFLLGLNDPTGAIEACKLEDLGHVPRLQQSTYGNIVSCFSKLNVDNDFHLPFTSEGLPTINEMNAFVQVYFEEFHPVLPLLHQPTFNPNEAHWVLALAVAATGCRFSQVPGSQKMADVLLEFLRRAIQRVVSALV